MCFTQGINVRLLTEEAAQALASVHCMDDQFRRRRLYTAWDNRRDEARLFAGLERLVRYGVKPDAMMVYLLIGYWPGETEADWLYRQARLRAFGARPYPMPYVRTPATVGFQRWCVGAYDTRIPGRNGRRRAIALSGSSHASRSGEPGTRRAAPLAVRQPGRAPSSCADAQAVASPRLANVREGVAAPKRLGAAPCSTIMVARASQLPVAPVHALTVQGPL